MQIFWNYKKKFINSNAINVWVVNSLIKKKHFGLIPSFSNIYIVVLSVHVALQATYRSKFLVDLLVLISVSTLRCSTHGKVGEKLIRTSLGSGVV